VTELADEYWVALGEGGGGGADEQNIGGQGTSI